MEVLLHLGPEVVDETAPAGEHLVILGKELALAAAGGNGWGVAGVGAFQGQMVAGLSHRRSRLMGNNLAGAAGAAAAGIVDEPAAELGQWEDKEDVLRQRNDRPASHTRKFLVLGGDHR